MDVKKIMIIDRVKNNQSETKKIDGYQVVHQFKYLGGIIKNKGRSEEEIDRHNVLVNIRPTKLSKIWKDCCITKTTKLKLVNVIIFPVTIYTSEI